jgi:phosphoglycolate phosphatase
MNAARFDLIVFDWDGTLSDSTRVISRCIQLAVADLGYEPPSTEAASFVIGLGLTQALAHAAPQVPREQWPQLGDRYRFHWTQRLGDIDLFDGSQALLGALQNHGSKLAIATGKSRSGLNAALEQCGLRPYFDATRTADETAGKPDPLMLHELMAELNVPPERTLMIGDTTHDLALARNAGCASAAVSFGAHGAASFTGFDPLIVAHSTTELHHWLLPKQ